MNTRRLTRSINAPVERVWAIVGDPGSSPGPGIEVRVEHAGSVDGTGLVRAVKVGPGTVREEITGVGPGRVLRYRNDQGCAGS